MKILITMTLYALGIVVFAAWILGDRWFISYLKEQGIWENSGLPKTIVDAICVAVVFIMGIIWPYFTIQFLYANLKK